MSVQCLYCQQVRAKNTTRQKQHLLQCEPYLNAHPEAALQASAASASAAADAASAAAGGQPPPPSAPAAAPQGLPGLSNGPALPPAPAYPQEGVSGVSAGDHTDLSFMPNPRFNTSPVQQGRPSIGSDLGAPPAKKQKTKTSLNVPEIPLRDVHAAFVEFRAKEDDKCMSARCIYCNQVRAKNTSRQREHLLTCPGYQNVLKEKIPANNLRHQFDEEDVASSLALPTPSFDLDFRMSVRVKPKLNVGASPVGRQSWVSCIGGQWAGRWGKGVVLVSHCSVRPLI
jgi:hypothetical protein